MNETSSGQNRLASEASLYLRQHGSNPVDWYPWGPTALEAARVGDRPILLSIGYSSCHWCHVMAHESFEDPDTARLMNEHFVNIKVDREERPDLDDVYMTAVQALAGQGGWPMTMFLTPDGRPFYGGTYFPPEERHGLPGFKDLLVFLAKEYRDNREEIERIAGEVALAVSAGVRAEQLRGPIGPASLDGARKQLMDAYEPRYGGFSVRPKFPQPATVMLLMRLSGDDVEMREALVHTLEGMIAGGLHDLVGGGFHRYSVDEKWLVPHFEKMLYDNALLTKAYLEAFHITEDARYRRTVTETLGFLLREMRLDNGGFAAALDADTPEGEGRFYAWSREELRVAAGLEDAGWAYDYFGFTPRGNYHGLTLPRQSMTLEELIRKLHITPEVALARVDAVRGRMRSARERNHVRPVRDGKLLVDWNGLAISAFALAGRQLGQKKYVAAARAAAGFILDEMRDSEGRLLHVYAGGRAYGNAFLDDYAALIGGLLDLHDADDAGPCLDAAENLTERVLAHFLDAENGGFFFTSDDHEELLARPVNYSDLPVPSGNALMVRNLTRLAVVLDRPAWRDLARQTLERFGHGMSHSAQGFSYMLLALAEYLELGE